MGMYSYKPTIEKLSQVVEDEKTDEKDREEVLDELKNAIRDLKEVK